MHGSSVASAHPAPTSPLAHPSFPPILEPLHLDYPAQDSPARTPVYSILPSNTPDPFLALIEHALLASPWWPSLTPIAFRLAQSTLFGASRDGTVAEWGCRSAEGTEWQSSTGGGPSAAMRLRIQNNKRPSREQPTRKSRRTTFWCDLLAAWTQPYLFHLAV